MNKLNYLFILAILFILASCSSDEDEITPQNLDPEVLTSDASIGEKGGVNFTASYESNGNEISEGGFEYSIDSLFNNKSKLIAEPTSDSQLKYFLPSGIEENVEYHYRAYVKSSTNSSP